MRAKLVLVSKEFLYRILQEGTESHFHCEVGIPTGANVERMDYDPARQAYLLTVTSPDYPEVQEGAILEVVRPFFNIF